MAHFDRVIPPGGEGKITLKVNTRGYQGKIIKSARVYTNDPAKRMAVLSLSAVVKVPIYLSPRYVYFYGMEGQKQRRVVDIIAKNNKPLELTPEQYTLGERVSYQLSELQKGRKFRLTFTSESTAPGAFYGYLRLKTNYKEKPEITIPIRGRILAKRTPSKILPNTTKDLGKKR